ncbi:MAG TPA: hypothetical protein VHC68_02690 [Candidatus Paceibacterota bacterium]|nr:hypothetical protein [Candidatus Paceibacterota bacterium]
MPSNRLVVLGVLLLVAVYGLVEAYPLLAGPAIELSAPRSGEATSDPVTVAGRVSRAAALTLDGAPLIPEEDGSFVKLLAFPAGSSILTLSARDRFGRSITLTRTIVVE